MHQVAMMMVGVAPRDARRILRRQAFDPLIGLEMVPHPEDLIVRVHPLVGMRTEAIHMAIARGNAAVCEFWLSATGAPLSVVRTFFPSMGVSSSLFVLV